MKSIYLCSTYYHILITLLKCIDSKDLVDIAVLGYIDDGVSLVGRIEKSEFAANVFYLPLIQPKNKIQTLFWRTRHFVKQFEKECNVDFELYDDIYVYMDGTCYSKYLKDAHIQYNLIEDSLDNFKNINKSRFSHMLDYRYSWGMHLTNFIFPYNYHHYRYFLDTPEIKSIEVNEIEGIQLRPNDRIIEKPREILFNKISRDNINRLLTIFLNDNVFLNYNNIGLILTYCFFTDGQFKDMNEQIELYKKVVIWYKSKGYMPVIKPHPRDKIDYTQIEDAIVINKNFPSELIRFIGDEKICRYFSIFSTATSSYPKEKVDYFDSIEDFISVYEE